jgi:putative spermidine/putrescine transport system ATP-binding protein
MGAAKEYEAEKKPMNSIAHQTGVRIELKACAKSFQSQRVLEPTSLEIESGETVVLLGPSGCGKTTTLRIIAGLEEPDPGGSVRFDDQDVTHLPIERRNVGMVFQSYALFPNMSVRENIEYGLRIRKVPSEERARRVETMLEMMEIGELAARRIDQLSGGQRQRVALARAIAPEPRVLLLDEPLTALDARLRETLRSEINRLLRSLAITAVYVTHDQSEAMALGDRIAVMERGRISQIGTPEDIYFRPTNPFVAEFVGISNLILLSAGEVIVRPEDMEVTSEASATISGIVQQRQFFGDHVRLEIALEGVNANRRVIARVVANGAPERHARVGLRIHRTTPINTL